MASDKVNATREAWFAAKVEIVAAREAWELTASEAKYLLSDAENTYRIQMWHHATDGENA